MTKEQKKIKNRRKKASEYFDEHGKSKYALKHQQQKKGSYLKASPFKTVKETNND